MPWRPTSVEDRHPSLARSLNQKGRERGTFDQHVIDNQIIIAAGLRIMDAWGLDSLPKGQGPEETRARERLLSQLSSEIERSIEDSVPFHLRQQTEVHLKKDVPAEMSAKLLQEVGRSTAAEQPEPPAPVEKKQPKKKPSSTWSSGEYTGAQYGGSSSSSSGWGSTWWSRSWWQQ